VNAGAPFSDVRINEFMAANASGLLDEDGEAQDWIEIVNASPFTVNLAGWSLTDNPDQPGQWTFPAVSLSPGEYRIVFASGKDRKPIGLGTRLHTNFKLERRRRISRPLQPRIAAAGGQRVRAAISGAAQRLFLRLDRQQRLAVFQDADARRGQRQQHHHANPVAAALQCSARLFQPSRST